MTKKELLKALTGNGIPKGEVRREMFKLYNSLVGKSRFMRTHENPNTGCGSCIVRVKVAVWNWYHFDESAPTYKGLKFMDKFGIHKMPIYKIEEKVVAPAVPVVEDAQSEE